MSWESPRSAHDSIAGTEKGAIGDRSWAITVAQRVDCERLQCVLMQRTRLCKVSVREPALAEVERGQAPNVVAGCST